MATYTDVDPTSKIWTNNEWQNVIAPQKAEETDFMSKLWSTIGGFTPLDELFKRYSAEFGLPQVREGITNVATQMGGLAGRMSDLPFKAQAQTAGRPVTQAQLERYTSKQAEPLQKELNTLAGTLQGLQTTAGTYEPVVGERMKYGLQERETQLLPYKYQADLLTDRWARELTGWSTQKQGQLEEYLNKLRVQGNLDVQELQNAGMLALEEKKFQNQLSLGKGLEDMFNSFFG